MAHPAVNLIKNPNGRFMSNWAAGNKPIRGVRVAHADFNDGSITPAPIYDGVTWSPYFTDGGAITNPDGTARLSYPVPAPDGNGYCLLGVSMPPNTRIVSLTCRVKWLTLAHAVKFIKFHGIRNGANYANCTFGLTDGGWWKQISFGDGSTVGNDTANVIQLDGSYPQGVGRSYFTTPRTAIVQLSHGEFRGDEWGIDVWHDLELYIKFNDGTSAENEVANGEFQLIIDGKVYVDAKGLFNRRYDNAALDYISFGDWAQGAGSTVNNAFTVAFDDIDIYVGG